MKASKGSRDNSSFLFSVILKIVLILAAVICAVPLYISLINVFKTTDQIGMSPFSLPLPPTMANINNVLTNPNISVFQMYFNSFVITFFGSSICILISSMAGYYLARTNKRFSKNLYTYFLFGLMVPYAIVYVPLVIIFKSVGLVGNLPGLILVFISGSISFSVFMFYNFVKSTPMELEESASIDGAGQFRIFFSIIFPLLKPCTTTVAIFIGVSMWNDFVTPLIIGQVKTITVGIYTAIGPHASNWGQVFAFVLFASLPIIIAYIAAQKQFVAGLTAGAVKG
jgi:raffinose/stachyose/melibiose transport system permease protein